jgi:hypothetical protein
MFHDVDTTVEALLRANLPADLSSLSISFVRPDSHFPPASITLPALNLFLYDTTENTELRTTRATAWRPEDAGTVRDAVPVRVDCHYIVTAWTKDGVSGSEFDEHRLLGAALMALLRHREIPAEFIKGGLKSSPMPLRAHALRPGRTQSMGELWQALGGKPKPSFTYVVTLAVEVDRPERAGPLVSERTFHVVDINQTSAETP